MSSPIWTPGALASELSPYHGVGWRLVEAQHVVSTLKLTDSLDEQALLESIIEATKPALPPQCQHLDYLLSAPFRYGAIYPKGSRFRRAGLSLGVYYAAEQPRTAVAEMAFYRLLFFAEAPGLPWPVNAAEYTAFSATISVDHALNLMAPPLDRDRETWIGPLGYAPCQALADSARTAGASVIRYESARDPGGDANLAVLHRAAFAAPAPIERRTWRMTLGPSGVRAICEFPRLSVEFSPMAFARDPRIAALNWDR